VDERTGVQPPHETLEVIRFRRNRDMTYERRIVQRDEAGVETFRRETVP
jgi:hypothetical protein